MNASEVALRVEVKQKWSAAVTGYCCCKVERRGGFADATLLVENGYAHAAL